MAAGSVSKRVPPGPDWITREIADLRKRLDQLVTARSLESATIGEGGLTVDGTGGVTIENGGGLDIEDGGAFTMHAANGNLVLYAATTPIPDGSGRTQQVFEIARDDGTLAFALADLGVILGHAHQQAWVLCDRAGNQIFAEDTDSGVGIASPYISGQWADLTSPTNTTTSSSFVAMQWADFYQQHPKVTAAVIVQTPGGTTGSVRMTVGGVQIGSSVAVGSGSFAAVLIGPGAWPGGSYSFGQRVTVQLEGKVTAGSGALGVRGYGLWGVQT